MSVCPTVSVLCFYGCCHPCFPYIEEGGYIRLFIKLVPNFSKYFEKCKYESKIQNCLIWRDKEKNGRRHGASVSLHCLSKFKCYNFFLSSSIV